MARIAPHREPLEGWRRDLAEQWSGLALKWATDRARLAGLYPADADDLRGLALLRLCRAAADYRLGPVPFAGYLLACLPAAWTELIRAAASPGRKNAALKCPADMRPTATDPARMRDVPDHRPAAVDPTSDLADLLVGLRPESRALMLAVYGEGRSVPEAAAGLGLAVRTAQRWHVEALETLRARMAVQCTS